MSDKLFDEVIDAVINDNDILLSDIPSIDLYMDQIITLIQEKYEPNKRFQDDKLLTKTMINNYSKEGLIKPVKGKKYTKEHIVQMLLIYSMKNTLSIQEIKSIFNSINKEESYDSQTLIDCYEDFIGLKEEIRLICKDAFDSLSEKSGICEENKAELMLILLGLSTMSAYMKSMAQAIIDTHFPLDTKKR